MVVHLRSLDACLEQAAQHARRQHRQTQERRRDEQQIGDARHADEHLDQQRAGQRAAGAADRYDAVETLGLFAVQASDIALQNTDTTNNAKTLTQT